MEIFTVEREAACQRIYLRNAWRAGENKLRIEAVEKMTITGFRAGIDDYELSGHDLSACPFFLVPGDAIEFAYNLTTNNPASALWLRHRAPVGETFLLSGHARLAEAKAKAYRDG